MTYTKQDQRKIDGVYFRFEGRKKTKRIAQKYAKTARQGGKRRARVIKIKSDKSHPYYVYSAGHYRKTRKRRK